MLQYAGHAWLTWIFFLFVLVSLAKSWSFLLVFQKPTLCFTDSFILNLFICWGGEGKVLEIESDCGCRRGMLSVLPSKEHRRATHAGVTPCLLKLGFGQQLRPPAVCLSTVIVEVRSVHPVTHGHIILEPSPFCD